MTTELSIRDCAANLITRLEQLDLQTGHKHHRQFIDCATAIRDLYNEYWHSLSAMQAALDEERRKPSISDLPQVETADKKEWKN